MNRDLPEIVHGKSLNRRDLTKTKNNFFHFLKYYIDSKHEGVHVE